MSRRRLSSALVAVAATIGLSLPSPAGAASAGAYTSWAYNEATGCYARAQVPYLDRYKRVVASPQVWCPRLTVLTVRTRIRSDRTFTDVSVGINGCTGTTDCTVPVRAGYSTFTVTCPQRSALVRHGYHSDILIYPGVQFGSWTGATSSSVTYSSLCGA